MKKVLSVLGLVVLEAFYKKVGFHNSVVTQVACLVLISVHTFSVNYNL